MKKAKGHQKTSQHAKSEKTYIATSVNTCVFCGAIIPEGTMVCVKCENGWLEPRCEICGKTIENRNAICKSCEERLLHSQNKK